MSDTGTFSISQAGEHYAISCGGQCHYELVIQGLKKHTGLLSHVTQHAATIVVDQPLPMGTNCFLHVYVGGDTFYSRGQIESCRDDLATITLENAFPLFKELSRKVIFNSQSTLDNMLQSKRLRPAIAIAETHHEQNRKKNCWEVSNCGKEAHCIAGQSQFHDGLLGGINGGRFCAFIEGTLCKDGLPLTMEEKVKKCGNCSFYKELLQDACKQSTASL